MGEGWVFLTKSMENGLFIDAFASDICFFCKIGTNLTCAQNFYLGVPKFFKMGGPKWVFIDFLMY